VLTVYNLLVVYSLGVFLMCKPLQNSFNGVLKAEKTIKK